MHDARNKTDLIIEVWERLDCESVGRKEIEAIEIAVLDRYGSSAVDSPMIIARLLADEGAELRHSEIMELYLERQAETGHEALLRNILKLTDLKSALSGLRNAENARRKFATENDKEGLKQLREAVVGRKKEALEKATNAKLPAKERSVQKEVADWLTIWLQTPEIFESWVKLRQNSKDFQDRFGEAENK
ncbi:MAG TPA: hypothetical protein VL325_11115 [Pyrinomonadaceae bacterium]|nr:hypothetical protein [Pyrinomonadaceae bacterium]